MSTLKELCFKYNSIKFVPIRLVEHLFCTDTLFFCISIGRAQDDDDDHLRMDEEMTLSDGDESWQTIDSLDGDEFDDDEVDAELDDPVNDYEYGIEGF